MKAKTMRTLLRTLLSKNKNVFYSSGITVITVISIVLFTALLFKEEDHIGTLILLAGSVAFSCLCTCIIYKKKTEKGLSTDHFRTELYGTIITITVLVILMLLEKGALTINYSLLIGLATLAVISFFANMLNVVVFSILTELERDRDKY